MALPKLRVETAAMVTIADLNSMMIIVDAGTDIIRADLADPRNAGERPAGVAQINKQRLL
jgi:hypothetical protein